MNVFYEEEGSLRVGSVLADNAGSLQVEAPHGKRSKVKAANVLMRFPEPGIAHFLPAAQEAAEQIDLDFLWECCGEAEFAFEALAKDYYGHAPGPVEAAAVALRVHGAPMYFYKRGKGRYKAAPPEALKAALASVERKRLQAEQLAHWAAEMVAGRLPQGIADKLAMLLHEPDRNALETKAVEQAARDAGLTFLKLLEHCGAIPSSKDYRYARFLREWFPDGPGFADLAPPGAAPELPLAEAIAYSIDDAATTEIDDAFSVRSNGNGTLRVGIHIAAPALGVPAGCQLDEVAAARLSTVYMPGDKITMLPEPVIAAYTLAEGRECPALSMYLTVDEASLEVLGHETRVERVRVERNLRHDTLERDFNPEAVAAGHADYPFGAELLLLHRLARALEKGRGKSDTVDRIDFSFQIDGERVRIVQRPRGSPIDKVVSELMIVANARWGKDLADAAVPGLYRAQANGKVRMSLAPAPHVGLGVAQYAWSTSPLRRYVDLVNQRQIMALARGEPAPYPRGDERLGVVLRDFELAYDAYAEFQRGMEQYWCFRWLIQEGRGTVPGTVLRESLVRSDELPLVLRVPSLPALDPGTPVLVEVKDVDPLEMTMSCRYLGPAQP